MYKNRKILAVIPARGGSKGVPGKNIRPAGGKPLIAWVIEAAKASSYIDRLVLSSDDDEIIRTATKYGCDVPFTRPVDLARDDSNTSDVIVHAVNNLPGYDYVVTLQPTSPLTHTSDIDGSIQKCIDLSCESCISVTEVEKSPYWMFRLETDETLHPLFSMDYFKMNRQQLPSSYIPNGAVYVTACRYLLDNNNLYSDKSVGYIMPKDRSLDIDTELDFAVFETVLKYMDEP